MWWWGWHGFWFFPFLLVAFIVVCRLAMGRRGCMGMGSSHRASKNARDLLDERFARGEITREQYREMRREMES